MGPPPPFTVRMIATSDRTRLVTLCVVLSTIAVAADAQSAAPASELWNHVEVRRTAYGVPHIKAENLRAAAYALAYVQMEDHGAGVAHGLLRARGELARVFGRDSIESDFLARRGYARATETYHLLDADTRNVYEGFAAGVNRYAELHPEEFSTEFRQTFTGYDVAARDIGGGGLAAARRFLLRMDSTRARDVVRPSGAAADADPDEGSNAWAFAPSRTKSGRTILLRNPHLQWTAGYYEAHITVPRVLEFYGDFRIGGPFGVVAGFNRNLGWATTNNAPDLDEIYALDAALGQTDRYMMDGTSLPLRRDLVSAEFRNGAGVSSETREIWSTPLGPVILRSGGKIYVMRAAGDGDHRAGEQFLRMMRARSLAEWKDAMRMRARINSNFTYADRAGNIYYVWNASIPALPHPSGGDTAAIPVSRTSDVWTRYVPFDSLPQVLNPKGGYVHNENDPPHFTNLRQPLDSTRFPANFPKPQLRLRSQHALELIDRTRKLSLEDVVRLKHSMRMLLADRVKADLIAAVRAAAPPSDIVAAAELLQRWDNTVAPESRGGTLFEIWWRRYSMNVRAESALFARSWTAAEPMRTPRGLADRVRAAEAFAWAVDETKRRFGSWDVAWGDVHRVRTGEVDVPVGGCGGELGCFRVLSFRPDRDGKLVANGGDGWVLAVEFTEVPRAYSILAYGQSPRDDSPHHSDQAEMFARGEMKKVVFAERDVEAHTIRRYRPGENK